MSFFPQQVFVEGDDFIFSKYETSQWLPVEVFTPAQQARLPAFVPGNRAAPVVSSTTESQSSTATAPSPSSSNTTIEQSLTPSCEQYLKVGDINKESCPCGWTRPRGRPTHDEVQRATKIEEARKHGYLWPKPVPEQELQQRELAKKATKEKREKRRCEKEDGNGAGKRQKRINNGEALVSTPQQIEQPDKTVLSPTWIWAEDESGQEITADRTWSQVEEDDWEEEGEQAQWLEGRVHWPEEAILGREEDGEFQRSEESEVGEIPASTEPAPAPTPAPAPELNNVWYALNYLDALKHHYNRDSNPLLNPDLDLFYTTYEDGVNGMVGYLNAEDPQTAPEPAKSADRFMGFPPTSVDLDDSKLW